MIRANASIDLADTGPDSFAVGRMLADEIRRFEVTEWNEEAWEVADADSQGWSDLYGSLLRTDGTFGDEAFEGIADPTVYLYRFAGWSRTTRSPRFCRLTTIQRIVRRRWRST